MKYIKHFLTITKHKYYVLVECFKRGLFLQGLVHDLSKYSYLEFTASARYFQGNKTPVGVEKKKKGYSYAWLNHKAKNKHHWEYWVDFKDGEVLLCPIPNKYIKEMCCDMIGASKVYLGGKYNQREPYDYFYNNNSKWLMEEKSKHMLKKYLLDEKYK